MKIYWLDFSRLTLHWYTLFKLFRRLNRPPLSLPLLSPNHFLRFFHFQYHLRHHNLPTPRLNLPPPSLPLLSPLPLLLPLHHLPLQLPNQSNRLLPPLIHLKMRSIYEGGHMTAGGVFAGGDACVAEVG